jgi:ABC-2 type transport system ATP-binding protein
MELKITQLTKSYSRDKLALSDFSLTLQSGIIGLLGPNGAGKSTLMKIVATISKPTSGQVTLDGHDLIQHPDYLRKVLGYLPQDFGVYPNLNAYEFLEYLAALKGVGGKGLKKRIELLLEGVNLTEAARKPIGTYSGGMKQRIGIAQALLNDPKVLIFDEPTVGLDPEERVRFRNLISDMAHDCIVILSSHIVSDIETIADRVVVMKSGQLIQENHQPGIIQSVTDKVFETTISNSEFDSFRQTHLVIDAMRQAEGLRIRFISDTTIPDAKGVAPTLEDAYLYLTKKQIVS